MTIELYTNNSEPIRADKSLTSIATLTGSLKTPCSIIDPTILITGSLVDVGLTTGIIKANYAYIADFQRYYFIRNITSTTRDTIMLELHVDVLSSFKDALRANKGIVGRAESDILYNKYINDGSLKAYQDPYVLTQPFTAGFTGHAFILAVAGG